MSIIELLRALEYCGKHVDDEEVVEELRKLYVWISKNKVKDVF